MEYVLQTEGVCKSFSGRLAVNNVSINVRKGDIYGFIGENGAGKTTLMRIVCGLAAPTSGRVKLFGNKNLQEERHRLGCTIENPALYPTLTALENMEVQRLYLGISDKSACHKLLDLVGLATGGKKAKNFSLGMKQRLMIALALLGEPEFLILDEPTNGLDPMGIKEMRDLFHYLSVERGLSVFISSHILGELEKVANCYGVISRGVLVDEFRAEDIAVRCVKSLFLRTSDPVKTEEILHGMFSDAQVERTSDGAVKLMGHSGESALINETLIKTGISVFMISTEGENLEDYFIKLMGGKQRYV